MDGSGHLGHFLAELADDLLFQTGYVALGDAHHVGDLLLRVLLFVG